MPQINLPGISQKDFHDAFNVLDECLITNVPVFGFDYPVMGPGGAYGENWWQLDSSLAIAGAKWANQEFAENVIRGFKSVQDQNPDGLIDLYGGSAIRGQIGDTSSLPRFFEMAYDIARRTGDKGLREEIYLTMKKYLNWWLSPVKRDATTGLITAVFEETFSGTHQTPQNYVENPQTLAPMDLNVAVALGCDRASALASHFGKKEEAVRYKAGFEQLRQSINRYLWDETKGAYYNYDVRTDKHHARLICTTLDPLRLGIAPSNRVHALIPKLLDPGLFNWGKLPLTSIAKTDPDYTEGKGPYNGSQWLGDVWAMRNAFIVAALEDVGRHDLAAELAWATINALNGNYTEYIVPSTGKGDGVKRYAWSASLYITCVIEHIFGVDYDRIRRCLRIVPRVPEELFDKELSLVHLVIPTGGDTRLDVRIKQRQQGEAEISVEIRGDLPEGEMEILLPQHATMPGQAMDQRGQRLPLVTNTAGLTNVTGVRIRVTHSVSIIFK